MQTDFKVIGCEGVDWIRLVQGRVQGRTVLKAVMNNEFHESGDFLDQLSNYKLA
jgi:hypothetical protein